MYKRIVFLMLGLALISMSSVNAKTIIWVAMNWDADEDGVNDSQEWVDKLEAEGYTVDFRQGNWDALTQEKVNELNAADLVIVSGTIQSGTYATDAAEVSLWNSVTAPMLNCCPYVLRSSRWKWVNNGDSELPNNNGDQGSPLLQAVTPGHPIFYRVSLDANNQVKVADPLLGSGQCTFIGTADVGNGTLIAKTVGNEWIWIAEWKKGVEFYNGAGAYATNLRMTFSIGAHEVAGNGRDTNPARGYNLTDQGWVLYLNTIKYMLGELVDRKKASSPSPADVETDVARNAVIGWMPGMYADTHNLFIGTDSDDVNDATVSNPLSTTVFEGLDANSFDPGMLEFGTTYYWRVDEVNAPSSPGTFQGSVWSFTVEPFARKIPAADIKASASGSYGNYDPNDTINESGLDPNHMDLHLNGQPDMWLSNPGAPNSVWIQYDFEKAYKLHQMLVWNYNYPMLLKAGFKDVIVEYSLDGQTWTEVPDVPQFAQGTGTNAYKYNTVVDFNDVIVKSVRIKQLTNWGMTVSGLSEVRFTYIPVWAREPKPGDEAVDVPLNTALAWRSGREASQHKVYISANEQMVIDGSAPVNTVSDNSYSPTLALGQTYYWRVDEVNNAEVPALWEGDIWSFTTEDYITVDDFEDYNDTQPYTVWDTWVDGLTDTTYGASRMGNEYEPFCEESIAYGGRQSAPLYYNISSAAKSEVFVNTTNLKIGSDWTKGSPETLVLWFYGDAGNSADKLYIKLNNSQKVYYTGDLLNLTRSVWWQWNIDLSEFNVNQASVQSITIGLEKVSSGVESHILIDEIRLYRDAPPVPTEDIWIEAESVTPTAPWAIVDDEEASGGKCIATEDGSGDSTTAPPAPAGTATYTFNVAGGNYRIELLLNTPDASGDSFWIRFPNATSVAPGTNTANPGWILFNDAGPGDGWEWDEVHSSDHDGQGVVVTLPAGSNTMQICYREDGAQIDVIRIMSVEE